MAMVVDTARVPGDYQCITGALVVWASRSAPFGAKSLLFGSSGFGGKPGLLNNKYSPIKIGWSVWKNNGKVYMVFRVAAYGGHQVNIIGPRLK